MVTLQTKKLGVLGLGSRSTLFYLEQLNQQYLVKHGGYSTCPLTLINANFDDINALLPHYSDELKAIVKQYLDELQGVDNIIIPNITLHDLIDRLNEEEKDNYPIIHPVKETLNRLIRDNVKQITLVASQYSMTSPYLLDMFADKKIRVLIPTDEDQQWLDMFRKKVYVGEELPSDLNWFSDRVNHYAKNSKVVIGCTEFSLALPAGQSEVYDMARMQIEGYFY